MPSQRLKMLEDTDKLPRFLLRELITFYVSFISTVPEFNLKYPEPHIRGTTLSNAHFLNTGKFHLIS